MKRDTFWKRLGLDFLMMMGMSAVLAGLYLSVCVVYSWAAAGAPINPSDTAAALAQAVQIASAVAAHKWGLAIAPALTLLFWILHQPWATGVLGRIPGKYRALAIWVIGTPLATLATHATAGGDWSLATITGLLLPLASTGIWEVVANPLGLVAPDDGQKLKADLKAALALADAKARDEAIAKIANG